MAGKGKRSNIEAWRETADAKEIQTAMSKGAYASHAVRSTKKAVSDKLEKMLQTEDIPKLMSTLLMGELTPAQISYVRSIVPSCIPSENISPLVALFYSVMNKAVQNGDAGAMEKLMKLAGVSAEMAVKLDVRVPDISEETVKQMSTEELLARLERCKAQSVVDADYEEVP